MKRPICPNCQKPMTKNGVAGSGAPRWRCGSHKGEHCHSTTNPKAEPRQRNGKRSKKVPVFKRSLGGKRTFIITAAQNATPVHEDTWDALKTLAEERSAELLVIPLQYANRQSEYEESRANEPVWDDKVQPYLYNQRKHLHRQLQVLGDINPTMTNISPLSGYEAFTRGESGIIGHPKLQLNTIPSPQNTLPKIMTTTGAITLPNYNAGKTGKLGEFHHTLGACLVELEGGRFHLRQLNADKDNGSFMDLNMLYSSLGVTGAGRAEGLVMGDLHRDLLDRKAWKGTQDQITLLRPKKLIWHDAMDSITVNPHHGNNVFNALAKIRANMTDVRGEIERTIEFIVKVTPTDTDSYIVFSNHPQMLARWIINTDPRTVPANLKFWCETALAMDAGTVMTNEGIRYPDPFIYWGKRLTEGLKNIHFLEQDESLLVQGVELGMHGHDGPNGARGSRKNLRRIGVRSIIGHGHSPGIDEGCYQVGTLTSLRLDYTRGPGSWLNTNCVLYGSGKRSLLNIVNGHWRT